MIIRIHVFGERSDLCGVGIRTNPYSRSTAVYPDSFFAGWIGLAAMSVTSLCSTTRPFTSANVKGAAILDLIWSVHAGSGV